MKADVFYCHACLDEMGLRRNGIRSHKRPKTIGSIEEQCPCCKQVKTLFNMRDYQRKKSDFCLKYRQRLRKEAVRELMAEA